jgi:hypothetical protein
VRPLEGQHGLARAGAKRGLAQLVVGDWLAKTPQFAVELHYIVACEVDG